MGTTVFKIPVRGPGFLAITTRPRGGDWLGDDVAALGGQGIDILVSLLGHDESRELGLADESAACEAAGLEFVSLPVPDFGTPDDAAKFIEAAIDLVRSLQGGRNIAVHLSLAQSAGQPVLLSRATTSASRFATYFVAAIRTAACAWNGLMPSASLISSG